MADRKAKIKINFWAFRWGALKGTPTARLRRALGKAEPVFPALRLRLGLETLSGSLSLLPTPSVLANATSKSASPRPPRYGVRGEATAG